MLLSTYAQQHRCSRCSSPSPHYLWVSEPTLVPWCVLHEICLTFLRVYTKSCSFTVEYKAFEIERLKVRLIASVHALYHWPFSVAAHIKHTSPLSVLPLSSAPNGHWCLMWLTCCFLSPACLDQRLLIWWQTRKQPELRHKEGRKLLYQ